MPLIARQSAALQRFNGPSVNFLPLQIDAALLIQRIHHELGYGRESQVRPDSDFEPLQRYFIPEAACLLLLSLPFTFLQPRPL